MSKKKHIEILARGVFVSDGQLLLCHTKGADNTYLPGGHVEFEESAEIALEREILEELGVESKTGRFLGAVEHSFIQKEKRHCEINLMFEMSIPSLTAGAEPPSCEDYIEFKWVSLEKLSDSNLEPAILVEMIPEWLQGEGHAGWGSNY